MAREKEWRIVPQHTARVDRGIGAADMAMAIRDGRRARTDGSLAFHVLETMNAIYLAARSRAAVPVRSRTERPEPLTAEEAAA
jgi:hypothetical protein